MTSALDRAIKLWQNDQDSEAIEVLGTDALINNAEANLLIGQIYIGAERGVSNIKRDIKKGIEFLNKSMSLGNSEAALELARLYYFGNGVKQNHKSAEQYWTRSYELGNELAGFELANYYFDDCQEKIEISIEIYKDLIRRNEFKGNCFSKLSKIYASGLGPISRDEQLSLTLYGTRCIGRAHSLLHEPRPEILSRRWSNAR